MARAFIALGSNLGDRKAAIAAAIGALRQSPSIEVIAASSIHETKPVGGPAGQSDYLNAAVVVDTSLAPEQLLQVLLGIEQQLGRQRSVKDAPRTIDLDILLMDRMESHSDTLTIPHPRMHQREFVLAPLCEVASDAFHPPSGLLIRELLSRVRGHSPSPFRLDGIRALVTGSTSGIGLAIAESLAYQGADVLIHGRRAEVGENIAKRIQSHGRRSRFCLADLNDAGQINELIDTAWNHWNGLDVLVNNAGVDTLTGEAANWTFEKKLEALWQVDVLATMQMSRAIGEQMKQRGRGCIINIGWDQAENGMEGDSGQLFAVSKGAVMAFTKSLAKTLAASVRVNCIAPGWIRTAWGRTASSVWQERVVRETPLGRWGTPADIATAACWLAAPAASFITGQTIRVNGGAVM